jgi:GDP-4-dehydro-6-deoxy-D-mannose reductase
MAQLAARPFEIVTQPSRIRAGEIPCVVGDSTKLYTEHGWVPRIPLQQSLADALDEWRIRLSADPAGVRAS